MKKMVIAAIASTTICSAPAIAADVPVKASVHKAAVSHYDWTGWYAGYSIGLGASQISASTPNADGDEGNADVAGRGLVGGVQAGYNWHIGPSTVAGVEGDVGFLRIKRSVVDFNDGETFGVNTGAYGTLRVRLGYSTGPSLFYLTGGVGFTRLTNRFSEESDGSSTSRVKAGLAVGGGLETMLGGNWSAKIEYLSIRAGDISVDGSPIGRGTAVFENRFHLFRYGMNYRFGGPAGAAVLPPHNWSGAYAGVNAGVGVAQVDVNVPDNSNPDVDVAALGFAGGVQAGYNWQPVANWVVGVEADIGSLGVKRSFPNWNDPEIEFGARGGWYGTARARLGYSTGPALLYVTGGAAIVKVRNNFDDTDDLAASKSKTAAGWTIGAGIETVLGQGWTAKTEYLYIDAGKNRVFNDNQGVVATFDNRSHLFRLGLNYKFGG
jgi:outer membrane immunogenic protein